MTKREPVTLAEWVKRYAASKNPQLLAEIERSLRQHWQNMPKLSAADRKMFIAAGFNHELLVEAEKLATEKRPVLYPTFLKSFPMIWFWVNPQDVELAKRHLPSIVALPGFNCPPAAKDVPREQRASMMMH